MEDLITDVNLIHCNTNIQYHVLTLVYYKQRWRPLLLLMKRLKAHEESQALIKHQGLHTTGLKQVLIRRFKFSLFCPLRSVTSEHRHNDRLMFLKNNNWKMNLGGIGKYLQMWSHPSVVSNSEMGYDYNYIFLLNFIVWHNKSSSLNCN